MKKIVLNVLKRIVYAFLIIYIFNLITVGYNIIIPINLITVLVVFCLGIPGYLSLIGIFFLL